MKQIFILFLVLTNSFSWAQDPYSDSCPCTDFWFHDEVWPEEEKYDDYSDGGDYIINPDSY